MLLSYGYGPGHNQPLGPRLRYHRVSQAQQSQPVGNHKHEKNDAHIKKGVGSRAGWIYRKEKPLRTPICGTGRRMLEAMSLSVSQCLHARRRLLPIACCGKDLLVLPMESIFSLT